VRWRDVVPAFAVDPHLANYSEIWGTQTRW
jgi:hypothetical protein